MRCLNFYYGWRKALPLILVGATVKYEWLHAPEPENRISAIIAIRLTLLNANDLN